VAQKFSNGRWVREGFLDNRIEGTVIGRIVFAAIGPVDFYLKGDFKSDIAGEVIQFRNGRFEDDDMAAQVIGDMENPQLGTVNLISFDPHPNLGPHPYIEWFSFRSDHYRFELGADEAWIVPEAERPALDQMSRKIREALADRMRDRPRSNEQDAEWW
jgi:hypothetical protein